MRAKHLKSPSCQAAARRPFAAALFCGISLLAGCSHNTYKAVNLPHQLRIPPQANAQTIDLSNLASTFASSELISPGDVLEVSITAGLGAEETISFPVRVSDNGVAKLPVIGQLELAGLELEGAEAAIVSACITRNLYRSPHVTVSMKRQRMNRVTVIGAVKNPGVYNIPRESSDLLSAIVVGGGLAEDAGTMVEIRDPEAGERGRLPAPVAGRAQPGYSQASHQSEASNPAPLIRVDLVSAAQEGTTRYRIADGGVVRVERRDPKPIQVLGLVNKPGRYDYPVGKDVYLLDALALAGGLANGVADRVFVIRPLANSQHPAVIEVSIRQAKRNGDVNLRLGEGDIVSVETTPATILLDAVKLINFGFGASLGTLF